MKGPTPTQDGLLRFILEYTREHELPPSLRDMRLYLGAASATAPHDHLKSLEKKGMVRRRFRVARGTTLTAKGYLYVQNLGPKREPNAHDPHASSPVVDDVPARKEG